MILPGESTVEYNGNRFKIVHRGGDRYIINGSQRELKISHQGKIYHIVHDGVGYNLFVRRVEANIYEITIKHYQIRVKLEDERTKLMSMFVRRDIVSDRIMEVRAPMPGLVIGINVKKGDYVKEGSELLILEAMKMENRVLAASNGVVTSIFIEKGKIVEKEQILLTIESK